ncbi:hypothetical protein [Dishui Lake phycodnavirus 2]|nr:hypothetical protein [Dishui Lake phycodnavirus 2]
MYIRWTHRCFLCSNPINFYIEPETPYECAAYYHYRFIYNPIPLFMNRMYYKFISKKLRRVCTYCFATYKPIPFRVLRDREIGRARVRQPSETLSVTEKEINAWLKDMPKFFYPVE